MAKILPQKFIVPFSHFFHLRSSLYETNFQFFVNSSSSSCDLCWSLVFCNSILGSFIFSSSLIFLWISFSHISDSEPFVLIPLPWSSSLRSDTSNISISLQICIICFLYPLFVGITLVETSHNYIVDPLCPPNSGIFSDVFSFLLFWLVTWKPFKVCKLSTISKQFISFYLF